VRWERPSLGDVGGFPAKFSNFLKFLLITLKWSFLLLSIKYYSVTLYHKSDNGRVLAALDPQLKHKAPKADSTVPGMEKAGEGSPSGLAGSQPENSDRVCAVRFLRLSNIKMSWQPPPRSLAAA